MRHVQYALVELDGTQVTLTHQDDRETPLVNPTLHGLIDQIADWSDCDNSYVYKQLKPDGTLQLDQELKIVKQVVITRDLSPAMGREIERLKALRKAEKAETYAKFGWGEPPADDD